MLIQQLLHVPNRLMEVLASTPLTDRPAIRLLGFVGLPQGEIGVADVAIGEDLPGV